MTDVSHRDPSRVTWRAIAWIALIVAASLGFSQAFACATPFAALAALAGTQVRAREAFAAVLLAWLGNQAIGFVALHYPQTWTTFGWGAAIGAAASAATCAASMLARVTMPGATRIAAAFVAAFALYEGVLLAATLVLPSGAAAFSLPVVLRIFAINAVALGVLLVVNFLATTLRLAPPAGEARTVV